LLPHEPDGPTPLFLNLERVSVATASYLRESILEFRNLVRGRRSNWYPIVANPGPDILDELVELVQSRNDILLACTVDDEGKVLRVRYIGHLDPKQKETLDLVRQYGETDASELMGKHGGVRHTTAWNNRLSSLSSLGLVYEVSQGRSKRYRTIYAEK
jgi:hypothetical protein